MRMETHEDPLIEMIAQAERVNQHNGSCGLCLAMDTMSDQARSAVERAASGTIGMRSLARILTRSGYPVGRRAVYFHRSGHTAHLD